MLSKIKNEWGRGTFILFITLNIFNLLNFLFHFVMGRMLNPTEYGTLVAIMTLIYLYSIPSEAIQNIITKRSAKINNSSELSGLFRRSIYKTTILGFSLFLLLIPISFGISTFLNVSLTLILFTNVFILFALMTPVVRGILQGRKRFLSLGVSFLFEGLTKFFIAIVLVYLGFSVYGAIGGVVLGTIVGFVVAFIPLFSTWKTPVQQKFQSISFSEKMVNMIFVSTITILFSLDVLLAKYFFADAIVGQYAVISMMGKMLFLLTTAISKSMFPITSSLPLIEAKKVFNKSLLLLLGIIILVTGFYLFLPEQIVALFYGSQYLGFGEHLWISSLAFGMLALSNLTILYGISINRITRGVWMILFVPLQILALFFLHTSLEMYLLGILSVNIILFISALYSIRP